MISKFIKKQLESHEVVFDGVGGNSLYYKVRSGRSGEVYDLELGRKINCTCEAWSVDGAKKGIVCSHLRKLFLKIAETGRFDLKEEE